MQDFIQFVINHWALWLVFVLILVALVQTEFSAQSGGLTSLTPQQVTHKLNKESAIIIDLRDKDTFNAGHIKGAKNLTAAEIPDNLKKLKKFQSKPVVICGASTQDVAKAGQVLRKENFEHLFTLKGGVSAWTQENYPLAKG